MWYDKYMVAYEKPLDEIPERVFAEIRSNIARLNSDKPVASVIPIAHNEERHLVACLWSLSEQLCDFQIEILGVDNASDDRTAEIYERCGVRCIREERKSPGYARQCGLDNARGEFMVCIDSDTMYPQHYVAIMVAALQGEGVASATSLWSFIPTTEHSQLSLRIYEFIRDTHLRIQNLNRPELIVRGMVFACRTAWAREVRFRTDIRRGEDGSLALGLKKYGRIAFVRNRRARAVTSYGTLSADGSIWNSLWVRIKRQLKALPSYFTRKKHYTDDESNMVK